MSSSTKKYENLIVPHITSPPSELSRPFIQRIIQNSEDYYKMYLLTLDILFDKFLPTSNQLKKLIIDLDLPELRNFNISYYDFFETNTSNHIEFKKFSKKIQDGITDEKIYISTRPTVLTFPELDNLSIKMIVDIKSSLSVWTRIGKYNNDTPYEFVHEYSKIDEISIENDREHNFNLCHLMKKSILPLYVQLWKKEEIEYLDNLILQYFSETYSHK
jgi:hypothetical protein